MNYLVVGAGLFGATFAHEVVKHGNHVTVLEKRDHIGGKANSIINPNRN